MAGIFVFPETLLRLENSFFQELNSVGINSLNLSMKYHASRHLSVRNSARMIHTVDGQHFYEPNINHYELRETYPQIQNPVLTPQKMDAIHAMAKSFDVELGAWSVFLHDENFGNQHPQTFAINVFGQSLRPNLCPLTSLVQSYLIGHTRDLVSLGFSHIAFESINFAPFLHNEHHERYFVNMSKATEFLLGLCFCRACLTFFESFDIDVVLIQSKLKEQLLSNLENDDPWLNEVLAVDFLVSNFGNEFGTLIDARCKGISLLHRKLLDEVIPFGIATRYLDGSPISNRSSDTPFDDLWQSGIDLRDLESNFDFLELLLYRFTTQENIQVASKYLERFRLKPLIAAMRPAYPDLATSEDLDERVIQLKKLFDGRLDFYMYELIRKREFEALGRLLH